MTPETIKHVQDSFALVAPVADEAAAAFYQRLFELDPSLRPMFKGSIEEQGRKLMAMLTIAVRSLDDLPKLVPALENLAIRHIDYGVKDSHYQTVGAALLSTLQSKLGDHFTDDVREAWTTVYGTMTTVMTGAVSAKTAAQ